MILKNLLTILPLLSAVATAAQPVKGCPDKSATNFNASATVNDGSCTYAPLTISPVLKFNQATELAENSGMIWWNGLLWQHNDGGGEPVIHAIDTSSEKILRRVSLAGATNIDWEDMAQDDTHIYIGDFGNNATGARTDLMIYKISKAEISRGSGDMSVQPETIRFRYPGQPDTPLAVAGNRTDFDCEAMVAMDDRLYLFSKEWSSKQTTLYALPKSAGIHTATRLASYDVKGLVTGADISPADRTILLTGYTPTLQRFILLLHDFPSNAFFDGNKRRVILNGFAQTESVAFAGRQIAFIGSENVSIFPQRLETIDLTGLLKD